jgi:enoyl-CoA hydratase/carnithine racemase
MAAYQDIVVERRGPTALVTLNRPERMNAYTPRMGAELRDAFWHCDQDDDIRAIVVTGAGRAFCAGAELNREGTTFRPETRAARQAELASEAFRSCHPIAVRKPIIAAINGAAVGVGLTMPLQWDIRLVAEDAKLGFVFVRRGLVPELGSQWILPRLIGFSRAAELMLTGRLFTGQEAAAMGLASRALPAAEVLPAALDLAAEMARECAPVAVALVKRQLWAHLAQSSFAAADATEARWFAWSGAQPDATEGVRAFMEKRPPAWSGSPSRDLPPDVPSLL